MNKGLLDVYALSVCFVSMGCLSIFSGILLYSIVEISFPALMKPSLLPYPPSFYSQSGTANAPAIPVQLRSDFSINKNVKQGEEKSINLVEKQKRFQSVQDEYIKSESIKSIIRSAIIILIASLVFTFHWRLAKQVRQSKNST